MSEQSIAAARASVMVYDDVNKKWVPSGSSSGLSKVHIYQHLTNNTFRVVGRKLQDHEVVINCAILKGLKYNQATATFHQWRDNKQVYGLNFSCRDDAEAFAMAMMRTLEAINQSCSSSRPSPHSVNSQPLYQTISGDIEGNNIEQNKWSENDRLPHQVQYISSSALVPPPNGPQAISNSGSPSSTGHRSMAPPNCAPPAPPAPPTPPMLSNAAPPPPPPPPPPPISAIPQCPPPIPSQGPPPPPPPMNSSHCNPPCPPPPPSMPWPGAAPSPVSLASALANAKLKKTPRTNEVSGDSGKPCGVPQSNMASIMDEMAKTLARRRAQAEGLQNSSDNEGAGDKKWDKQNSSNGNNNQGGLESPKNGRRQRIGSISDMDALHSNGPEVLDMERLKQEILIEIRMEINKMKQEIIDVIRMENNRR